MGFDMLQNLPCSSLQRTLLVRLSLSIGCPSCSPCYRRGFLQEKESVCTSRPLAASHTELSIRLWLNKSPVRQGKLRMINVSNHIIKNGSTQNRCFKTGRCWADFVFPERWCLFLLGTRVNLLGTGLWYIRVHLPGSGKTFFAVVLFSFQCKGTSGSGIAISCRNPIAKNVKLLGEERLLNSLV